MPLLFVLVLLAVLGAIAVLAAGRGGSMDTVSPDRAPGVLLPDGDLEPAEIEGLRFSLAFRGYRMDEVDATLDRLAAQLADRDERVAELEAGRVRGESVVDGPAQGRHETRAGTDVPEPPESG